AIILGWTRGFTHLIRADRDDEGSHLVRVDLRTHQCETLARRTIIAHDCNSPAWITWTHIPEPGKASFWRLSTEPDGRPTPMPALDGWFPFQPLGDHRFLLHNGSVDATRHVIADVRHDLGAIVAELTVPPHNFLYSAALNAFVAFHDRVCEIWTL